MVSIRGAITVDENTKEAILEGTRTMLELLISENNLKEGEIVSIFFSTTKDLTAAYPAVAARDMGITDTSLLCLQEMYVEGSLNKCVRILMHIEKNILQNEVVHVYLEGAKALRPDLKKTLNHDVLTIAIDGPAGAGKSTIAKQLANYFKIVYVDTGAMYRAVALYMIQNNIDITSEKEVVLNIEDVNISISYKDKKQIIYLNNKDVTETIREQAIGESASRVSAYLPVRKKLVKMQQEMAKSTSLVMDGRDIGTHVLTKATLKIYLTADVMIRARRRYEELIKKGINTDIDVIAKEIEERDDRDMNRKHAPLKKAKDGILVDTSLLSIDEVVKAIIQLVETR